MSSVYTHQKRPYKAAAVQWDGANTDRVKAMVCTDKRIEFVMLREYIVLRFHDEGGVLLSMTTLQIGDWVRLGENGVLKTYTDELFKVKYVELT